VRAPQVWNIFINPPYTNTAVTLIGKKLTHVFRLYSILYVIDFTLYKTFLLWPEATLQENVFELA
jgi:hypothetical protein